MADPADMMAAYTAGTLTRPTAFVQSLLNNPKDTLRKYPINMGDDGSLGASGVTGRCFVDNHGAGKRPGSVLGTLNMHAAEGFQIVMTNIGVPHGHQISVHRVATVQANQAPSWCLLPATAGPDIMATCQLTGCAFIVRAAANNQIECAHLLPTDLATGAALMTGVQLNQQLKQQNYLAVYGREEYAHKSGGAYDRSAAIIGVRRNGAWKIYAQKQGRYQHDIRSVHRIYPA